MLAFYQQEETGRYGNDSSIEEIDYFEVEREFSNYSGHATTFDSNREHEDDGDDGDGDDDDTYTEKFKRGNIEENDDDEQNSFEEDSEESEETLKEEDKDEITQSYAATHIFDYQTTKINGVNLGGWLVTEPFITPSLYERASSDGTEANTPIDEYNFCLSLGPTAAHNLLKPHWENWITEDDIIKIKNFGFNAVRLPIGYWAFAKLEDDPYVFGQEDYLIKTIEWCRKYGLKMWIDLHGIPGSQNGFDNSGRRDTYEWMMYRDNYDLGIQVLQYIYDKYTGPRYDDVIIGYQNLNEPLHNAYEIPRIVEFDQTTYKLFRQKSSNYFVFHDAFLPPAFWHNQMDEPTYTDVVLDHHRYEVFDTTQLRESIDGHITSVKLITEKYLSVPRIQIVGEWSAAMTDCAKWLNGVGRLARIDNTFQGDGFIEDCRFSNDHTKMTRQDRINTRRLIEAQLDVYNQTNGFFFWTWKTEDAIEWSMVDLAQIGLFPVPLDDRKYPRVV